MSFQYHTAAARRSSAFQLIADRIGMAGLLMIGLATATATALVGA